MDKITEDTRLITGGYRNEAISFIRLLSLLMIIICHIMQFFNIELAWWFNFGVQIFLCISGFFMGRRILGML